VSTSPESFSSENNQEAEPSTEGVEREATSPQTEQAEPAATPQPSSLPEAELPPEAQGELNGGPLGCCLGVTIGLLLSLSIALISRAYASPLAILFGYGLSSVTRIAMALVAIIAVIICGTLGWRLGKHLYREYELSPRQKKRLEELEQRHSQRRKRR